jgi:hypothetical protein
MKFVTFAALAITADAKSGALNYLWSDMMACPDFRLASNLAGADGTGIISGSTGRGETFLEFKQSCAEFAYGLSAEVAPCLSAAYFPGGVSGTDNTGTENWSFLGVTPNEPFYGCMAFEGTFLNMAEQTNADRVWLGT